MKPGPVGSGNHRMALDSGGIAHIAYEYAAASALSQPRYARMTADAWDHRRTVDNATMTGIAGEDLCMIVIGDEKNVVYVTQARTDDNQRLPYSRIVRARWSSAADSIEKVVLVDHLPLGEDEVALVGVHVAAAADASGALHVVYAHVLDADAGGGTCRVRYLREAAGAEGGLEWLQDDVSAALPCASEAPWVALAVEPGGRPHIGYVSEGQGVVYATRYDR